MENTKLLDECHLGNQDPCSAEARWEKKQVYDRKQVYRINAEDATLRGMGQLDISNEVLFDGEATLALKTNMDVEDKVPRPTSSIRIDFHEDDWRAFNRVSLWVYPQSTGFQDFYFHFSLQNKDSRSLLHAPALLPNQWNHVIYEIDDITRDKMVSLSISPYLFGCPPEALPDVTFYFSSIWIEKVDADHILGWELDDRIAYCHSGYFIDAQKQAMTGKLNNTTFHIIDKLQNRVFEGQAKLIENEYGRFFILDFSKFNTEGEFALIVDERQTPWFSIADVAYASAIEKSINFLFLLRCGYDVPGVHSPCHQTHHTKHPDGRLVGDSGGWHDAGDVSQFEICTAEMAHALLDCADALENKDKTMMQKLLDEARWGLLWLLKTHFGDGYRALSVHYSIWRRNHLKDFTALDPANLDFHKSTADNGPFENFLASMALARGATAFENKDKIFANWCLRTAVQDFNFGLEGYEQGLFTKRWGKGPAVQVIGALVQAACELFEVTKKATYLDVASKYAHIITDSQQITMPLWEKPMRGFFYEDPSHQTILSYEHRGHEQTPICGLIRLLELMPDHKDAKLWKNCVMLYADYVKTSMEVIAPYRLLPAQIYAYEWLNRDRFTIPKRYGTDEEIEEELRSQIKEGIRLDEGIYLRRLPIALQRRGFHATLLSKAKGVSMMGKYLQDKELVQIAIDQLEWILGKNPFATSSMYQEGHNYHPLYVAFSPQLLGALPVGFKTLGAKDAPYWPTCNNAVFKEIWGHTTGKFLWVLADILASR